MTLDDLAVLLDDCTTAGRGLTELVAAGNAEQIREATTRFADLALALHRAMPQVDKLLASCPQDVRAKWRDLIHGAAHPLKVGAEASSLGSARVAAQLAVLAQASGTDTGYASNGQLAF